MMEEKCEEGKHEMMKISLEIKIPLVVTEESKVVTKSTTARQMNLFFTGF